MITRVNLIFNLFALLIFFVELFTPLFISTDFPAYKTNNKSLLTDMPLGRNQPLYLVAEELDGKERSENNKPLLSSIDFDFIAVFNLQTKKQVSTSEYNLQSYACPTSKPRLFILNRLFLI